jgi:hypothetical protein
MLKARRGGSRSTRGRATRRAIRRGEGLSHSQPPRSGRTARRLPLPLPAGGASSGRISRNRCGDGNASCGAFDGATSETMQISAKSPRRSRQRSARIVRSRASTFASRLEPIVFSRRSGSIASVTCWRAARQPAPLGAERLVAPGGVDLRPFEQVDRAAVREAARPHFLGGEAPGSGEASAPARGTRCRARCGRRGASGRSARRSRGCPCGYRRRRRTDRRCEVGERRV